jgi:hypothetical protein
MHNALPFAGKQRRKNGVGSQKLRKRFPIRVKAIGVLLHRSLNTLIIERDPSLNETCVLHRSKFGSPMTGLGH